MSFLNKIIEHKKVEIQSQKLLCGKTSNELHSLCKELPPVISFEKKIKKCCFDGEMALIAEVKKASPSKGLIRADFNPVEIAKCYEDSGASAISVLTDEKFFQGSINYLIDVKKSVNLPVLRKDFIIDSFQIYQTRLMGADMMLLIASALSFQDLKKFYYLAKEIGLEILIEVHDDAELNNVLTLDAKLIGINNRNLSTFQVDINKTIELVKNKDLSERFIISESGINTNSDLVYLKNNNISGILVGESLMRQSDIKKAVKTLLLG